MPRNKWNKFFGYGTYGSEAFCAEIAEKSDKNATKINIFGFSKNAR